MDKVFDYYRRLDDISGRGRTAVVEAGLGGEEALLRAVAEALHFPGYFGENFDALWDCLRDLPMPAGGLSLVHADLPPLVRERLALYVEILRDAVRYWLDGHGRKRFRVYFPLNRRRHLESVLRIL